MIEEQDIIEEEEGASKLTQLKSFLFTAIKILGAASVLFILISIVTIIIDSAALGRFSPRLIFTINFYASTILLFTGVMLEFFPVILPKSKLLDHSTHGEFFIKSRLTKRKRAFKLVYLGFAILFVTATCQLVLSKII